MLTEPQGIRPATGRERYRRLVSSGRELAAAGAGGDDAARVLTWNLWWHFGPWEARQPAILETLRRVDADVVCLQEVWEHVDGANQAADLAGAARLPPRLRVGPQLRVRPRAARRTRCFRGWPIAGQRDRVRCPRPRGSTRCGSRCVPTSTAAGPARGVRHPPQLANGPEPRARQPGAGAVRVRRAGPVAGGRSRRALR